MNLSYLAYGIMIFLVIKFLFRLNTISIKKTAEQQDLISILNQHMFQPLSTPYLTEKEANRRIRETKDRFREITKDNPKLLKWLIGLEDYGHEDSYGYYYKIRVLILNLINEFDQLGDILFSIASSSSYEWYVRRGAIESLDKRADIKHLKKLIAYLPLMKTSEVYNATIEAFAHHHIKEALDMIKKTSKKSRSFSDDEILQVRAKLGDEDVLLDLMAQQHNPWRKERMQESLKILVEQMGEREALAQLHKNYKSKTIVDQYRELYEVSDDANISYWALKGYDRHHRDYEFLIASLNHDDWYIRDYIAQELIDTNETIDAQLKEKLNGDALNNRAKYWIIYTLIKRDQDVSGFIDNIEGIKIKLPDFIDQNLRESILKEYYGEDKTDIRWSIERLMLNIDSSYEDESEKDKRDLAEMKRIEGYLKEANITMDSLKEYGEVMRQGSSTFYVFSKKISVEDLGDNEEETQYDEIHVSTLGKYAIHRIKVSILDTKDGTGSIGYDEPVVDKIDPYREVLKKAGYSYLSMEQRDFVLPLFYTYYFGHGESLTVEEFLFYWQD